MATKKSPRRRTDKQRALLCTDDMSELLQSPYSLPETVRDIGLEKIIGMVNSGLDDFSIEENGACLSLLMVGKFLGITRNLRILENPNYFIEAGKIRSTYRCYQEHRQELGDVLYIYNKLKSHPNGLNWKLINAYDQQYPDAKIPFVLKQMDNYKFSEKKLRFFPRRKERSA